MKFNEKDEYFVLGSSSFLRKIDTKQLSRLIEKKAKKETSQGASSLPPGHLFNYSKFGVNIFSNINFSGHKL